jgi:outer membrane immunogenic protein
MPIFEPIPWRAILLQGDLWSSSMKKTIFALAFIISSPAMAEDWTGPYAGLTFGKGGGDFFVPSASATGDYDSDNVYGIFGGYNFQHKGMVYGAELAYLNSDITNVGFPDQGVSKLVDLKARVGFVAGPSLVYGVIGYSTNEVYGPGATSDGDGLALGIGFDYEVMGNFIVGGEYLSRNMQNDATGLIQELEPDVSTFTLRGGVKF